MPSQAAVTSGRYDLIGSLTRSLPRSSSSRIAAAVNCLLTEASRNLVVGVFGMFHSRMAAQNYHRSENFLPVDIPPIARENFKWP
jgi:hypothetical protein